VGRQRWEDREGGKANFVALNTTPETITGEEDDSLRVFESN
jgi:hypothetical protein